MNKFLGNQGFGRAGAPTVRMAPNPGVDLALHIHEKYVKRTCARRFPETRTQKTSFEVSLKSKLMRVIHSSAPFCLVFGTTHAVDFGNKEGALNILVDDGNTQTINTAITNALAPIKSDISDIKANLIAIKSDIADIKVNSSGGAKFGSSESKAAASPTLEPPPIVSARPPSVVALPVPFNLQEPPKYIIYSTGGGMTGGFGSRLWGVANVYLWSLLTGRTFVMEYNHPHPFSACFEPADAVRWTAHAPAQNRKVLNLVDRTLSKQLLEHGDLEAKWKQYQVVEVRGANMPCEPLLRHNAHYDLAAAGIPAPDRPPSKLRLKENRQRMDTQFHAWKAAIWHVLFRPTSAVLELANPVLKQMASHDTSIALHIREGGSFGGAHDADTSLRLKGINMSESSLAQAQLDWFIQCATKKSVGSAGASVAWVVASDHVSRVKWVASKTKYPVLSLPKKRSVHTDRSAHQTVLEWRQTVADWIIISKATRILISPSYFSLTAAMWAGKTPTMAGEQC